jgi:hypothetical protein
MRFHQLFRFRLCATEHSSTDRCTNGELALERVFERSDSLYT